MIASIDTSLIDWSRAQFALTAMYHWLFVPLTLGLGVIQAIMETIYYKTGNEFYIDVNASFRVVANNMKYGNCKVQGGFNIQRRNQDENSVGFDSRDDQRNKNNYTLDVNNGKNGRINFEGNSYSNIKVMAK